MSFQAAEPTAHSNHTNWTGMAQGTLKAEVSKIRPGDQNQPDKESSLVHWMTLQIVKEGLNFWVFKCIFNKFSSFSQLQTPGDIPQIDDRTLLFLSAREKIRQYWASGFNVVRHPCVHLFYAM